MALWIEVKARYEKPLESGKSVNVTDTYLVDALSCAEAEARVVDALSSRNRDCNVLSVGKTKISEVLLGGDHCDKFYKIKVNFTTIHEKTATEKRPTSCILVKACGIADALRRFSDGMKGTTAGYEIEAINETKIADVFKYKTSVSDGNI